MNDKWVHLTTAPDQLTAEIWLSILQNEGIAAIIMPSSNTASFLGMTDLACAMQVREDHLAHAREVLGDEALDD